jgi:hypothetical protein
MDRCRRKTLQTSPQLGLTGPGLLTYPNVPSKYPKSCNSELSGRVRWRGAPARCTPEYRLPEWANPECRSEWDCDWECGKLYLYGFRRLDKPYIAESQSADKKVQLVGGQLSIQSCTHTPRLNYTALALHADCSTFRLIYIAQTQFSRRRRRVHWPCRLPDAATHRRRDTMRDTGATAQSNRTLHGTYIRLNPRDTICTPSLIGTCLRHSPGGAPHVTLEQ